MPKIPQRKNRFEDERNIDDTLDEMYQDDDGSRPDMKHFDYKKSRAGLVVVFFILFFLASAAAAAWLGFFLFSPSQKFSENQVVAEIITPTEITNGIEQDYKINVRNTGSLALANTRVILKLPEGFVVTESTPKATNDRIDSWTLGAIDGNESRAITLKAVYAKPSGTEDNLRAYVDFKPSNFNSEFEKVTDTDLKVVREAVLLSMTKKPGQLEVTYKNLTETTITNLVLGVDAGTSFKQTKTNPPAKMLAGVITLQIPELLANKDNTFTIDGAYSPSSTPPANILTTITKQYNNKPLEIAKFELANAGGSDAAQTEPAPRAKPLSISVNGAATSEVKSGDTMKFVVTYKNTTDKPVTNVALTLVGIGPSIKNKSVFDYTSLGTIGDPDVVGKQINPERREARITWTPEKTNVLKEIAPGQQVVIELSVGVKPLEAGIKDLSATYTLSLSADNDVLSIADPATITIAQ